MKTIRDLLGLGVIWIGYTVMTPKMLRKHVSGLAKLIPDTEPYVTTVRANPGTTVVNLTDEHDEVFAVVVLKTLTRDAEGTHAEFVDPSHFLRNAMWINPSTLDPQVVAEETLAAMRKAGFTG